MCNCVKEIEEKTFEKYQKKNPFRRPVKRVELKGVAFLFGENVKMKTVNELEIELEGQKRTKSVSVVHSFCPFCGEKFE